jgi:5-methylthioadenosine/S-adenosylhomocysteine deaminase
MYDLIIENASIVTCDRSHTVFEKGVMAVRDGKIAAVEDSGSAAAKNLKAKKVLKADGRIMMPGLVNMHCHAADSLFRGLVENLSLEEWLGQVWIAEKATLTPETCHLGGLLGLAENLLAGVTTVMDMFWYPEASVRAARELGMRISAGGIFFDLPGIGERSQDDYAKEAEQFIASHAGSDDVFAAVMPHGTYTVAPEHLVEAKAIADRHGAFFNTHAAETRAEQADIKKRYGKSVIRHLNAYELLGPQTVLAHCVHVDKEEIGLMADTGTVVVHNPMSNLKLGSGIAPVAEMQDAGVRLTLGTDGAISGNDLDMWLAMRLATGLAKGATMDPKAVSAADTLHMATLNGAEALGQDDRLGSLEAGKSADFIMLDALGVHATPIFDLITHLVFSANRNDVRDVFVEGRQLVKDGQLAGYDIKPVLKAANALVPEISASLKAG